MEDRKSKSVNESFPKKKGGEKGTPEKFMYIFIMAAGPSEDVRLLLTAYPSDRFIQEMPNTYWLRRNEQWDRMPEFLRRRETPPNTVAHDRPTAAVHVARSSILLSFPLTRGSAQWVLECPAIQTRVSAATDSPWNPLRWSPSVCLDPSSWHAAGLGYGGGSAPLRPNPRVAGISSKPTSQWRHVAQHFAFSVASSHSHARMQFIDKNFKGG